MKPTAGNAKPRRPASRFATDPNQTKLNLQRRPRPEPEGGVDAQRNGGFWKWVLIVTLLHAVAISIFYIVQAIMAAEKPAPIMVSLVSPGDIVKGTAGQQAAKKVGLTTAAPKHAAPPPQASAPLPTPPTPKPPQKTIPPKAELKMDKPTLIQDKPAPKPPVKPPPPKPKEAKVKVDLHLADGPQTDKPKPTKTKTPVKKPAEKSDNDDETDRDTHGLSKEEIAAKLGAKSDAEGTRNAKKIGTSGATNGTHNDFSSFYTVIAEQIHDEWNSALTANQPPVVGIHVERNGHIPADSVHLIRSSGNAQYDDAAVDTVKRIGQLRESLPEGCPPDITITFNPNS